MSANIERGFKIQKALLPSDVLVKMNDSERKRGAFGGAGVATGASTETSRVE